MSLSELKELLQKDYYRIYESYPNNVWIKYIFANENFRFTYMFRLGHFLMDKRSLIKPLVAIIRKRQRRRTKISLPKMTVVGPGLNIFHLKNINISQQAIIGSNFTIGHQSTIGRINHGKLKGSPEIGDNVFIGPGAMVLGKIKIGNNVLIAANSFVTQDVPSDSVVYGNPCIIKPSKKATEGYVVNRV